MRAICSKNTSRITCQAIKANSGSQDGQGSLVLWIVHSFVRTHDGLMSLNKICGQEVVSLYLRFRLIIHCTWPPAAIIYIWSTHDTKEQHQNINTDLGCTILLPSRQIHASPELSPRLRFSQKRSDGAGKKTTYKKNASSVNIVDSNTLKLFLLTMKPELSLSWVSTLSTVRV